MSVLEAQVIGGLIHHPGLIAKTNLAARHFVEAFHVAAFGALVGLLGRGQTPDPVSVAQAMGDAGNMGRMLTLWKETQPANADTCEGWIAGLLRAYRARALKDLLVESVQALAREQTPETVMASVLDGLAGLEHQGERYEHTLRESMTALIDELDERAKRGGDLRGIPSGLVDLDAVLSGFQPGRLYILGARPAMGKTSLMSEWAIQAALQARRAVGIISAEMGHRDLAERAVASHGRINSHKLAVGSLDDLEWAGVSRAVQELVQGNIRIYDRPAASIADVSVQARAWKLAGGLDILFVDYLSLLTSDGRQDSRVREVGDLARAMKTVARRLEIPVVCLAQLSRACEQRPNKRPLMADLRDSGEIEQEADVVLFLYRDEVYHPESPDAGIAEISIAKNRHGPCTVIRTVFVKEFFRFENFSRGAE